MDKLITITEQKGIQLVDARELHRKLNVQTKFTNWFPRRVEEYSFDEGKDYFTQFWAKGISQTTNRIFPYNRYG